MEMNHSGKKLSFPENFGKLLYNNQLYKLATVGYMVLAMLLAIVVGQMSKEAPFVVVMNEEAQILDTLVKKPLAEANIEQALRKYISFRYNYDPKNIETNFGRSLAFVSPIKEKPFREAMKPTLKFVADRGATSRAYVNTVRVDLNNKKAIIEGDRVTSIQGLLMASPLKLELNFEPTEYTTENPWGIAIASEKDLSVRE